MTALPFGRHVGRDVREVVDADRNYAVWVFSQPWFRLHHPALFSALRRVLAKRLAAEVSEEDDAIERRQARDLMPPAERFKAVPAAQLCREAGAAATAASAAMAQARADSLRERAREAERISYMLLDAATAELCSDLV